MSARGWTQGVAVAVVVIMAVGSLGLLSGLGAAGLGAHPSSPAVSTPASTTAPAGTSTSSSTTSSAAAPSSAFNAGSAAAQRALSVSKAAGISPRDVFVPRPSASPSQVAQSTSQGYVTPLYTSTPAPMGLAEFGLAQDPSTGNVSPFILNTTSVQATFNPLADGPYAIDLADSSPDGYGVQLNAVVTNVTLFGNDTYQFWTQNVVEYYPFEGMIYLITNVWNFSSPASYLSSNVFYQHGPFGTQVGNEYYYAFLGPIAIQYPFNMTFTMTSNITDGRNAVYFSLTAMEGNSTVINATNYDYVIFNSLQNNTSPPLTTPANYQADGYHYNPLGLTNDFELTIGGPGGGSQTTFATGKATETLSYWDNSTGAYEAVPSAYSYGGETGETSVGVGMSWDNQTNGQPIGYMTAGPSLLGGLWNASSPSGGPGGIALTLTPANAFVWVQFNGTSPFNVTENEWAPVFTSTELVLPAGYYLVTVELADYASVTLSVTVRPLTIQFITVNLVPDAAAGVYTPLWAWNNTQIAAISTAGNGTQWNPYILVNNENGFLGPGYGVLNDYGFPVFPGVFFLFTTAYTEFASPPSFEVNTTGAHVGPNPLPDTNNLPYWFYDTSNIAIVNATDITGWFSAYANDYPYFLTFNVEFWNSTNMLIANNTFATEAMALLVYNGFSSTNPFAAGLATIWGNLFVQTFAPGDSPIIVPFSDGIGLSEQENFDTIYNNAFYTPTTAMSYPTDLYYGYLTGAYADTWNITPMPAANVSFDSNWPQFPLSGSIIGGSVQGGNFWWDYGLTVSPYGYFFPNSNPYTTIPYTESGWLNFFGNEPFGDYAPLLPLPLESATVAESGLPAAFYWSYSISNVYAPGDIYYLGETNLTWVQVWLPDGSYQLNASANCFGPVGEVFTVNGTTLVNISFSDTGCSVTFQESGLAPGVSWIVQFNGEILTTTSAWLNFTVSLPGTYVFYAATTLSGWVAIPASGSVSVTGAPVVYDLSFTPYIPTYSVYFTASGIYPGTWWWVVLNNVTYGTDSPTMEINGLTAGSYYYSVDAPGGYTASPPNGTFAITTSSLSFGVTFTPITYTVTFVETGLVTGTLWSVNLGGVVVGSTGTELNFTVTAGTYDYLVGYISGYNADPDSGSVTVGPSTTIYISFS